MAFFRKRKVPVGPPPPIEGKGFANPTGGAPYVSAHHGGLDGTAPTVLNPTPETGLKSISPPADKPPQDYYNRRNAWRIDDYRHDQQSEPQRPQTVIRRHPADDPKREPPPPSRPTAFHSPSGSQFVVDRPLGLRMPLQLNGNHFSMATMRRAYPIAGMSPARRFRNTWRLEPSPRDAQNVDMPPPVDVPDAEYVSPRVVSSLRAFRLG